MDTLTMKAESKQNVTISLTPTIIKHLEEILVLEGSVNKSGTIQALIQERYLDLIQDQA